MAKRDGLKFILGFCGLMCLMHPSDCPWEHGGSWKSEDIVLSEVRSDLCMLVGLISYCRSIAMAMVTRVMIPV